MLSSSEPRVLIAHSDEGYVDRLVARCRERQIQVVGPARTACMALALAALGPVSYALISRTLPDDDGGQALARTLDSRWGLQSRVIDAPDPDEVIAELAL